MRSINGLVVLLSVGVAAQASADPPAPPAQNAAPVTSTAAPAMPAVTAAAPATAPTAAKTDTATNGGTASQIKLLRSAGYKPKTHNGQTYWCRREAEIGTRFEKESCGTADDLERQTKEAQDMATQAQQKNVYNPKGN